MFSLFPEAHIEGDVVDANLLSMVASSNGASNGVH